MTAVFERYVIDKFIDEGAFSKFYLAHDKYTYEKYAIKIVETQKLPPEQLSLFETEKNILRTAIIFKLKNIIKLINVMKDPFTNNYLLAFEYCDGGDLHRCLYNYINKYGKPFPEDLVRHIMKEILIGLKGLHNLGIIHRDVKLKNILLKYKNPTDIVNDNIYAAEIKIIDFNASYFPNSIKPKTVIGTIPNMAPSIMVNALGLGIEQSYDEKIDIWSLGII